MELRKIIEGCINDDKSSQEALFKMQYGKLMSVSIMMSPNRQIAEDLLQDSFIKIFKNIHKLNTYEPAALYSWSKRILRNVILDYYRKNKNFMVTFDEAEKNSTNKIYNDVEETNQDFISTYDLADDDESDEPDYYNVDAKEIISLFEKLSPQYKLVFTLYVIDGFSHKEISDKLKISVGTSKSNLSKARENLRKELNKITKINKMELC